MDRLQGMAAFVRVVELGSFSAAARELGLSKSAVSKQVAALEQRLGVRLIHRSTRRLALTEAGTVYRDQCARIVEAAEVAEEMAMLQGAEPRGRLKVAAPMSFGFLRLGPILPEFLDRHPGIELELTLNDRYVDLIEEGYDLAVRIGQLADSSLMLRRLATARNVCAASPAYLGRAGLPATPHDLAAHNCLGYGHLRQAQEWSFVRGAERVPVRAMGNLQANNGDVLRVAACAGLGVVCMPDFILGEDLAAGRLVPLLADWQLPEAPIQAVFPAQRHSFARLRVFLDFLIERLGGRQPWDRSLRTGEPP
ncbi:MAG: LysR family transcriptional regulator [Geminicoccaceae bacterium]